MSQVKVRLTHMSYKPGAEGAPGDEITIPAELAETWEQAGGCVILKDKESEEAKAPAKPATKAAPPAKPATKAAPPAKSE